MHHLASATSDTNQTPPMKCGTNMCLQVLPIMLNDKMLKVDSPAGDFCRPSETFPLSAHEAFLMILRIVFDFSLDVWNLRDNFS